MSLIKILDGGMGTEFISQGIKLPHHTWSADINIYDPTLVYEIHKKYIKSGSDYITTNTFRTTPRAYLKTGLSITESKDRAYKSLKNAVKMAQKAKGVNQVKILGSIAPLEDCYKPSKYPGNRKARLEFLELSNWFVDCGIDVFILETMNNLPEILICLKVLSSHNTPIWVSLNLLDEEHILSGEKISTVVESITKFNISTLLLNCNSIEKTNMALDNLTECWKGEWGIYPNLGIGEPSSDGVINNFSQTEDFIEVLKRAVSLGATILGGCCGSDYSHIRLLSEKFK
jgi:homocysteine S-methyltransferase